jgi:hypothetical protein
MSVPSTPDKTRQVESVEKVIAERVGPRQRVVADLAVLLHLATKLGLDLVGLVGRPVRDAMKKEEGRRRRKCENTISSSHKECLFDSKRTAQMRATSLRTIVPIVPPALTETSNLLSISTVMCGAT